MFVFLNSNNLICNSMRYYNIDRQMWVIYFEKFVGILKFKIGISYMIIVLYLHFVYLKIHY